ncbi:hypothetical protein KKG31_02705 [Patescibacteria group bacterium]|nr:hypothetical protein [Patescibacteria group bacterium]MBU1758072.1 hypothetical protein [Patescibacteria group bacterium]
MASNVETETKSNIDTKEVITDNNPQQDITENVIEENNSNKLVEKEEVKKEEVVEEENTEADAN